jgi:hypothetical protein
MPLDLAWRDKNRRRSAAFCDDTRNTRCPRAVKNTATGSQAAPAGPGHHLQPGVLQAPGQRRRLDSGQAFHSGPGLALGHDIALAIEHAHRVRGGDAQADAGQPPVVHPGLLG